jgi:hypothetical protein
MTMFHLTSRNLLKLQLKRQFKHHPIVCVKQLVRLLSQKRPDHPEYHLLMMTMM